MPQDTLAERQKARARRELRELATLKKAIPASGTRSSGARLRAQGRRTEEAVAPVAARNKLVRDKRIAALAGKRLRKGRS